MDRPASAKFVNIAAHLTDMAQRQPERRAVVFPKGRDAQGKFRWTQFTFRQLDEESDQIALGFDCRRIGRGTRTVLMVTPSLDFFALTFALFKVGAVPVMVDPGIGLKNLGVCLAEAEPEVFIGVPKAQIARMVFGWGKPTLRKIITVGTRILWIGDSLDQVRHFGQLVPPGRLIKTRPEDQAAILFTSGSTGVPKGVVYTHGMFADQVEKLRQLYGIQPGEIDLPTFPLFALFAPALGMTAVIPEMDPTRPAMVNPLNIIDAIEQFKVTNMFGSPALINRVGRYGEEHQVKLPTLKRVISAGAPVAAKALERYAKMLSPGVQIFTPYGATESLPVSSIGSDEILGDTRQRTAQGHGVCVGHPVPGMTAKIVEITDAPIKSWSEAKLIPVRQIGEIVVKSGNVTREYYHRPESTALAKIPDPDTGEFYHRMGDVGYLDETGRLWFCGRKTHRVITARGTMFTITCEAIFNNHPKVFRSALVGVPRTGSVEPVICVELEAAASHEDQGTLRAELLKLGAASELTRDIKTVLFHPAFPVDIRHNAKIFREKLAVWAAKQ